MSEEIRIYMACLAAYNNGKLHGVWIDATQDLDDIQDQVNEMLEFSPEEGAEAWAIHDYEGYGSYNNDRTHQGKMCCGRTPKETLLDGKTIWAEKNLVQI